MMKSRGLTKILLAVDGSNQSLEAVRYTGQRFSPQKIEVVLLHVLSSIPEFFYDLGKEPKAPQGTRTLRGWEMALKDSLNEFMGKAHQILIDAHIPGNAISIDMHERREGIARDIISESHQGYSAVVVGRTGLSKFEDFIIGSVASKLIERLAHVSVCVVGGKPGPGKILLALDESENARRAVDFVSNIFARPGSEVTLFHVFRGINVLEQGYETRVSPRFKEELIDAGRREIEGLFEVYRRELTEGGFDSAGVTTKLITGVRSRSRAIVEEAKKGGHGTIVVGRRGLSKIQEFIAGRVSSKVVQLATEHAVWVVN